MFGVASAASGTSACDPGNEVDFAGVFHHLDWIADVTGLVPPTYDHHDDLLWRHTDGTPAIWFMDGERRLGDNVPSWYGVHGVSNDWQIAAVGDVSSDGRPDLLWRHTNGALSAWFLVDGMLAGHSTPSWYQEGWSVGHDWKVVGIAHFQPGLFFPTRGIIWRNVNTGKVSIWFMRQGQMYGYVDPGTRGLDWSVAALDDFNGDGTTDLAWRHTSGAVGVWLLRGDGQILADVATGSATPDWRIAGAGDFDRDGKADLLWHHHKTGTTSIWFLDGGGIKSQATVSRVFSDWSIRDVGDFDGDARADILWRQTTGALSMWFMNGATVARTASPGTVGSEWSIVDATMLN